MLIREGEARDDRIDRHLAWGLSAVAGGVNAVAFYAVGFFSANMTGNVSTLSDHIALGEWATAGYYLMVVLAFIAGAAASTFLVNIGQRRQRGGIYAAAILIEASLLTLIGLIDLYLTGNLRPMLVIVGLSFSMGLQNAVVTRISNARVRTTHVSGMATDIGIELAMLIDIARKKLPDTDPSAIRARLRLHTETIACFLAGGVVGVLLYRALHGWSLVVAATVLMAIALPELIRGRRSVRQPN